MSESIRLKAGDGHESDAYVSRPSGEPIAGLVVSAGSRIGSTTLYLNAKQLLAEGGSLSGRLPLWYHCRLSIASFGMVNTRVLGRYN